MNEHGKTEMLRTPGGDSAQWRVVAERLTGWPLALDCARATRGHKALGREPSEEFKRMALRCEHSPIRAMVWRVTIEGIPYFAAMHLVRHKIGCEWFVCSQRSDITGVPRDNKPQSSPVSLTLIANAAALIAISRERLCGKADETTRTIWHEVCRKIGVVDQTLADFLVPKCVRFGFCPEDGGCGFIDHPVTKAMRRCLYGITDGGGK